MCKVNYEIGEFYMTNTSFNNKTNNQTETNTFKNKYKLIFGLLLLTFELSLFSFAIFIIIN